jgi:SH3-like domain-containing protein
MKNHAWITLFLLLALAPVALAERLAVGVPVANIRSGPGENYDILWAVEKYHPLNVLKKSGEWYHFRDFEGDEGWIHKSLLQKISSVITTKENCNVRSGPDTRFEIVFTVDKGIPFKVLKREGSWIQIQHADGDKGWVHESLIW